MRFGVLGSLEVTDQHDRPVDIPGTKVRCLLTVLLIHPNAVVSADRLADALWGDAVPAKVESALRSKVSQLRQAFRNAGENAADLITWQDYGYRLNVDPKKIDTHLFEHSLRTVDTAPDSRTQQEFLSTALSLWRGDPFGEFRHERFALAAAADLEEKHLSARERRASLRVENGQGSSVVAELTALAQRHPLREGLHALLMRSLYQAGRQSEALDVFSEVGERLRDELGLDPGPDLVQAQQDILRQNLPAAPSTSQQPASVSTVPEPLTDLVGREAMLSRARKFLRRHRLVTLTGPGGVGKTRTAVELVREVSADFHDGIQFIDLSTVRGTDASQVYEVMAEHLGVRDDAASGGSPLDNPPNLRDRLLSALLTKRSLLVLDNCEQARDAVTAAVHEILGIAGEVAIVATSRDVLGLQAEQVVVVDPLDFPNSDELVGGVELGHYPALRLLADRIRATGVELSPTPETVSQLTRVAEHLDGLPLALELAAARVRVLGLSELVRRMDDRFRLLRSRSNDRPSRQRTLDAVISWSWDLTTSSQRTVLGRLASTADGMTLAALEEVCEDLDIDLDEDLTRLVEQSLVYVVQGTHGPRYRLLQTIRAFVLREQDDTEASHRAVKAVNDYFVAYVLTVAPDLRGRHQETALRSLRDESANIRLVLERLLVTDVATAASTALEMMWFWVLTGRITEAHGYARHMIEADLESAAHATAVRLWHEALSLRLDEHHGDVERSTPFHSDIADDDRSADRVDMAHWYRTLTRTATGRWQFHEPSHSLEDAMSVQNEWISAAWNIEYALAAWRDSVLDDAVKFADAAHRGFSGCGDMWGTLQALDILSRVHDDRDALTEAERLDRMALQHAEDLYLVSDLSRLLTRMGRRALMRGEADTAKGLLVRARDLAGDQCDAMIAGEAAGALKAIEMDLTGQEAKEILAEECGAFVEALDYLK
ncbi:AfsR/SARP family transcriptional regulator [Haloglycomyces albus]|uniref:AfsR/SARP family transcriptional regulator n=1 Tax=Haloglycomyces albus TaxID=526067 RepID=UPI000555D818|nr:BTAD domain-containing putative transcriptional regulator [Haloglycomyces albus]